MGINRHPVNLWRDLREIGDEGPEGIVFAITPLPSGDAWWVPEERVILMEPGLLQVERRCRLGHEFGHRALGHVGQCRYGDSNRQSARNEEAADVWAARQLITLQALVDVLMWTDDREEAAEELWVTVHLLDVRLKHIHPCERAWVAERLRASQR